MEEIKYPSSLLAEHALLYSLPLIDNSLEDIYYRWKTGLGPRLPEDKVVYMDSLIFYLWLAGDGSIDEDCISNTARCLGLNIDRLLYLDEELRGVDFDYINEGNDDVPPHLIVYP